MVIQLYDIFMSHFSGKTVTLLCVSPMLEWAVSEISWYKFLAFSKGMRCFYENKLDLG